MTLHPFVLIRCVMAAFEAQAPPLSTEQICQFKTQGYTILRQAFPRPVALECRDIMWDMLAAEGILRDDPTTWVRRKGFAQGFRMHHGKPWSDVFTTALHEAIDQLLGCGRWEEFGLGWWVISFPGHSEPPYGVDGHWHVDGAFHRHYPFSKELGLVMLILFSDIDTHGGGTMLSVGSHAQVAHSLISAGLRGLSPRETTLSARQGGMDDVVTITGRAGDVALVHPFLLHARGKNLGPCTQDAVRFLCHPCIRLKEHMNLHRREESQYSALEQSVVNVMDQMRALDLCVPHLTPEQCVEFASSHGLGGVDEDGTALYESVELIDDANDEERIKMNDALGFAAFGKRIDAVVEISEVNDESIPKHKQPLEGKPEERDPKRSKLDI